MTTQVIWIVAFSLIALAVLVVAERRGWRGLVALQRLALILLLAHPVLWWLPKWHVLPTVAEAGAGTAGGGGGGFPWIAVWLVGVMFHVARLGYGFYRLGVITGKSRVSADPRDGRMAETCAAAVGLKRVAVLRVSAEIAAPAACGILRPVVLLPVDWVEWDADTKRAVLLHEMGHHARCDPFWRLVALATAAVYWFNPWVWWLAAKLQSQAEYLCDERVIGCGVRADSYAHILCDLAGRAPTPALAMAAPGSLEQRVRRLQEPGGIAAPVLLGSAALLLAVTAVGMAVLRPDRRLDGKAAEPPPAAAAVRPVYTPEEVAARHQADPFPGD